MERLLLIGFDRASAGLIKKLQTIDVIAERYREPFTKLSNWPTTPFLAKLVNRFHFLREKPFRCCEQPDAKSFTKNFSFHSQSNESSMRSNENEKKKNSAGLIKPDNRQHSLDKSVLNKSAEVTIKMKAMFSDGKTFARSA